MANTLTTEILSALQSSNLQQTAPTLYDVLRQLTLANDSASTDTLTQENITGDIPAMTGQDVTNFVAAIHVQGVLLTWDFMCGENVICSGISFEIRSGNNWATAQFVTRTTSNSIILPTQLAGTYTYLIKGYNGQGTYSTNAASVTFTVKPPDPTNMAGFVIGNFPLLYWSTPSSSFTVDYYNVSKNGVQIATVKYPFYTYFEPNGGGYTYTITAVDIAGNIGNPSPGIELQIPLITNYVSYATKVSDLTGTLVNCYRSVISGSETDSYQDHFIRHGWASPQDQINAGFPHFSEPIEDSGGVPALYVGVDTTKTWQTHFTSNGWNSPQAQVNAGFPIFIEPLVSSLTASYTEIFDFDSIYNNVIVTTTWDYLTKMGVISVKSQIEVSTDKAIWTTISVGQSYLASSVRYVRLTLTFKLNDVWSLWVLYNLTCNLDVANVVADTGSVNANSGDATGTHVNFNKTFKALSSLTLKPATSQISFAVHDFAYGTNPSGFNTYLYGRVGNRISGAVNWTARGMT